MFGLVGKSLSHSYSKKYFEEKFAELGIDDSYELIEIDDIGELKGVVSRMGLTGFNVTIPYKCDIIPLLDEIDPVAREIGAVNTVVVKSYTTAGMRSAPKLIGYNTDAPAFMETIRDVISAAGMPHLLKALILGSGGASRAAQWAIEKMGIEYRIVSRNAARDVRSYHDKSAQSPLRAPLELVPYDEAGRLMEKEGYNIIVNATPVGMYPDVDASPWPYPELLDNRHLCYDMIYNPSPTLFLQQAAEQGAATMGGLEMLHRQADLAYKIWSSAQ